MNSSHLPRRVLYYGFDKPLPEVQPLRAGPLSMLLEGGDLRYLRFGNREVIRRIYVAVRDRFWGTIPAVLSEINTKIDEDRFQVTYQAEHIDETEQIDFVWTGEITGEPDGTIVFKMDGAARSTFLRSRIGFCILHPATCAGARCRVVQEDGAIIEGTLPQWIQPDAPFLDMTSIAHEVQSGLHAELHITGDLFEMEDQRNWSDASFKTFCTPLRLPYPVEIKEGTRVEQSVTLSLDGTIPTESRVCSDGKTQVVTFDIEREQQGSLPTIGVCCASHNQPLTVREIEHLKRLQLSHLRVDLRPADNDFWAHLIKANKQAQVLGVPLEMALHLSGSNSELDALTEHLREIQPTVCRWLLFRDGEDSTSAASIKLAKERLLEYCAQSCIGSGTNYYFTELNRARPPLELLDCVCYSLNPQVHAFDNSSLVETLQAQADTVLSARKFIDCLPLAVTPITLRPRFNKHLGADPPVAPGQLPFSVDERQMSLFGACWTVGSLKYLAQSGADSVTYYETTGWKGVMETASGSPLPEKFCSIPESVFPLYHVMADCGELAGGRITMSHSSRPLQVDGLVLIHKKRKRVLVANMTDKIQQVEIRGLASVVHTRVLDETNVVHAMTDPEEWRATSDEIHDSNDGCLSLLLNPYAVIRLDMTI